MHNCLSDAMLKSRLDWTGQLKYVNFYIIFKQSWRKSFNPFCTILKIASYLLRSNSIWDRVDAIYSHNYKRFKFILTRKFANFDKVARRLSALMMRKKDSESERDRVRVSVRQRVNMRVKVRVKEWSLWCSVVLFWWRHVFLKSEQFSVIEKSIKTFP